MPGDLQVEFQTASRLKFVNDNDFAVVGKSLEEVEGDFGGLVCLLCNHIT